MQVPVLSRRLGSCGYPVPSPFYTLTNFYFADIYYLPYITLIIPILSHICILFRFYCTCFHRVRGGWLHSIFAKVNS
jgi:hypothetical protein